MSIFRNACMLIALGVAAALVVALPAAAQDKKKGDKAADAKPAEAKPAAPAPAASSGGAGYKIGVVDIEQVIENYPKKIKLMADLKVQVDADQAQVDTMTNELDGLQKDYKAQSDKMSDTDKSAKQGRMRELVTKIKAETETRQGKIDQREADIRSEVFADVNKAIAAISESENYHLVLNSRSLPNSSVLYASPTIDMTSKVSAQLGAGGGK